MEPRPTKLTESTELIEESFPVNDQFNLVQNDQIHQYYASQQNNQPRYPTFDTPQPKPQGYANYMVEGVLPKVTNYVQGTYQSIHNSGMTEITPRQLTLKVPACLTGFYDRIMERKGPKTPFTTKCPHCSSDIATELKSKIGMGTLSCGFGLCLCCPHFFWLPFAIDECYDHEHKCPHCKQVIMKEKFLC